MLVKSCSRVVSAACVLTMVAGAPVLAKKPSDTQGLQKAEKTLSDDIVKRGTERIDLSTGAMVSLGNGSYRVSPGTPEQMAREFLAAHAGRFGLRAADTHDLRLHGVREGLSGVTVRFHQYVGDLRVFEGDIAVTYNHDGVVRTVASSYRPQAELPVAARALNAQDAEAAALDYLGVGLDAGLASSLAVERKTTPVVDIVDGRSYLAYQVDMEGYGPLNGWRVMVDSADGKVMRAIDTKHYVDGQGRVFTPDPLSSATADYGDTGFVDGNDANTTQLTAESPMMPLRDITENAGTFTLVGPWAENTDWDSPFKGNFAQNSSTFNFLREADAFEAVNTYYHIDAYMRYLNEDLGVTVRPYQYAGGVQFDPSGANGSDNSFYTSGSGRLSFGEGGVDDAEDADVVIHELGHGLHDWITMGGLSQVEGLSEGIGDYAAASYSRTFAGQWTAADEAYNWTFSWDGHNPFWGGRVTNWNDTRTYPGDLGQGIHRDGQFWASCNIDIWEQMDKPTFDRAFWEGLSRTNGSTNQTAAAQAIIDAAVDLGINSSDIQMMINTYNSSGCNYGVMANLTDIFANGFESGDLTGWTSAVP